jgi:hypothetical protein
MPQVDQMTKAFSFAERLLGAALDVVGAAQVTLDKNWARNPKIVGLTLLTRSLTNFRAAMILLKNRHVHMVEARVLARCIYENLIWIGALRERGSDFVNEMLSDEAANRAALGELALKISTRLGADANDENGLVLRGHINATKEKLPGSKKLHIDKLAENTVVGSIYVEYSRLSLEAVHCSITALGRHLERETIEDGYVLTVNVHPDPRPDEILNTLVHLSRGLLWTAITSNELLGFTSISTRLGQLADEFDEIEVYAQS